MRMTVCDVCDEQFDPDTEMIEMSIPSSFIDGDTDGRLSIDVCSWNCLSAIGPSEEKEEKEENETPRAAPNPPSSVSVPAAHTTPTLPGLKLGDLSDESLDEITEQITGVKRKW